MSDDGTNNPAEPPLKITSREERAVEPAPDATPARAAGELVVQGLLESLHRRDAASREARIETFFAGLENPKRLRVFPFRRVVRWGMAIAAVIALTTTLVLIGVPGESTALAEVRQSIRAMRAAGDRRYEVSMAKRSGDDAAADVNAIIDMRSPNLLLIRHKPPGWNDFAVGGRDEKGAWAILKDGTTTRTNPERQWPPFVTDGGETFMTQSIDKQLEELPELFTFAKTASEKVPGAASDGLAMDRITATRKQRSGFKPSRVDLWIDPASHFVERIEYRWDEAAPGGSRGGPGGGGGSQDGDHDRGPKRGGPRGPDDGDHHGSDGDRPPPPRDRLDGPGHGPGGSPPPSSGKRGGDHGSGGHGSAQRLVVFQRVDAPTLPPDWFTPEGHGGK